MFDIENSPVYKTNLCGAADGRKTENEALQAGVEKIRNEIDRSGLTGVKSLARLLTPSNKDIRTSTSVHRIWFRVFLNIVNEEKRCAGSSVADRTLPSRQVISVKRKKPVV